jgi:hypothetical protein
VDYGLQHNMPVSEQGITRSERRIGAANRRIEHRVNSSPGTPIDPTPTQIAISEHAADVGTGGRTTPVEPLEKIAKKTDEHLRWYWGAEPEKPYIPAMPGVPAKPARYDSKGNIIPPQPAIPPTPAQPYTPAVPPQPISAQDALKIRNGVNRRLGDNMREYTDSVDENFDKAVRKGINEELYRVFPDLKHIGKDESIAIRVNQEIDARLRGLTGKDMSMSSAYGISQMAAALNPVNPKLTPVGTAAWAKNFILTPEFLSEVGIALKNRKASLSSNRAKAVMGKARVRAKMRPLTATGRVGRENEQNPDPPKMNLADEVNAARQTDVQYSDDNPYAQ